MIRNPRRLLWIFVVVNLLPSCGTNNLAESQAEKTKDDQVRQHLDKGELDEAIELLKELTDEQPENYSRFPLLAAAYAAKGGLNLIDILKTQLAGISSSGGSVFSQIDAVLPNPLTSDHIDNVSLAVATLRAMPEVERTPDLEIAYSSSASFQYTLYLTILPVMKMKRFFTPGTATLDPTLIQNMTLEEALDILNTLAQASSSSKSEITAAMATAIDATLTEINTSQGADSKEKLANFAKPKPATLR